MRNISFALTTAQFLDGSKSVTRRLGWKTLKPGDVLMACRKCQGLRPGEKIERLGPIRVVKVWREQLYLITKSDVIREGFPDMSAGEFVDMFCKHMGVQSDAEVTRIEFERIDAMEGSQP